MLKLPVAHKNYFLELWLKLLQAKDAFCRLASQTESAALNKYPAYFLGVSMRDNNDF